MVTDNFKTKQIKQPKIGSIGIKVENNLLTIDLEKLEDRKISAGKREVLEVTFRVYADTIARILNNPVGIKFDMMAEVSKYSTYTQQMTAYASIDKNSASRNEKVQIDTDNTFVTDTFENDTTIAPTFKLSKGTQTELSGIVYEDSPKESTPIKISGNNIYERVGDGIYNNENVMANVLVELLSVPMENGQYDSDTARTGENGQQAYDVAKLCQEKGTIRSATAIYTSDGKTKLKEIEAREYKSTVITSGEISNAMNITDGKAHLNGDYSWFLKSPETRYSDAVDDVEYRANLEKEAKINYEILKGTKTYVYENMEAYTPYFKLGVEEFNDQQSGATLETQEDGTLNYVFTIDNVDFGLIERPIVDLQVDKVITGLKVSLGNGQVLINGDPSKESLPYVRTGLDDFVPIEMDTELLQNATIEEEYTIKITNNSELDYSIYPIWGTDNTQKVALRRNYYYYGTQEGLTTDEAVTARIDVLGDYIGSELTADENTMPEWNKRAIEELTSYRKISFDIIWWSASGLKVPNTAIVYENDIACVVRQRAGYLEKVYVKILKQNDKYSIVSNYSSDELESLGFDLKQMGTKKSINMYDEVLVNITDDKFKSIK